MIAIAIQMTVSLVLCFVVGFATAWIIRGSREEQKFQKFFDNWRGRYDRLELDCDVHLARISALQKELNLSQATRGQRTQSVSSTASNLEIE